LSPLLVHFVSSPETDLKKGRVFVEQMTDAFPHWQPAHLSLAFVPGLAAAFAQSSLFFGNCRTVSTQHFAAGRDRWMRHGAKTLNLRKGHFYQPGRCRQCPDRNKRNRSCLANRWLDLVCH